MGFFDDLVEDFAKTYEMQRIIEFSKDENGKVDKAKATGIALGLGHTSLEDAALFGAMLGEAGAFDEDE